MAKSNVNLSVKLGADTSEWKKALKEANKSLKTIGDSKSIEEIKENFDKVTNSTASAEAKIGKIKELMREMQYKGWDGDDMFNQMAKHAVELDKVANKVKDTIKAMKQEGMNIGIAEQFKQTMDSGDATEKKLESLKQLLSELIVTGQTDTPLFANIIEEAKKLQVELTNIQDSQKRVNDILNEQPKLSIAEQFENIKKSANDSATKLREMTNLIAEMIKTGQQDTPLFQEIVNSARELKAELEADKKAMAEANDTVNQMPELSFAKQFENIKKNTQDVNRAFNETIELLTQMNLAGENNSELYDSIVKFGKELKDIQNKAKDAKEEVTKLFEPEPPTIAEQFEEIKNSAEKSQKQIDNVIKLLAQLSVEGQADTPLFEEMTEWAKRAQEELDNLNNAEKEITKGIKNYNEETSNLTAEEQFNRALNSADNLTKKEKDMTEALTRYVYENKKIDKEKFNQMATELKKVVNETKEWKKAQETVNQAINGVNFNNIVTQLSGISTAMVGLTGMFGKFGNSAVANIQKITGAMATMQGLQTAMKTNVGGLGPALANPYVLAGAAIVAGGTALYEYNKQLDASLRRTAQFTGLSGKELISLRNGIKATADTFGTDYNTMLSAVDNAMAQFGIGGEKALKTITDGFVAGANDGGRFLELLKQYSPAFNDMGISMSELTALIAQTRSGIFSEDGLQMISMAGKNIRQFSKQTSESLKAIGIDSDTMFKSLQNGSITTMQALKQIAGRMKNVDKQSQATGEVLRQVFGKSGASGGYELVTALADIETNLDIVKQQTEGWGQAMEELQNANRRVEDAFSQLFGITNSGFAGFETKIKTAVLNNLAAVMEWLIKIYNESATIRAILWSTYAVAKNVIDFCIWGIQTLVDLLVGLEKIIDAIGDPRKWGSIGDEISKMMKQLTDDYMEFDNKVGEVWKQAYDNTLNGQLEAPEITTQERELITIITKVDDGSYKSAEEKLKAYKELLELSADDAEKVAEYTKQIAYWQKEANKRQYKPKTNNGDDKDKKNKDTNLKAILAVDDGSLKIAQDKLKAFENQKITIPLDDAEALAKCQENINKWKSEVERRSIILGIKTGKTDLRRIYDDISRLEEKLNNSSDTKEIENLTKTIEGLKAVRNGIENAMGIDGLSEKLYDIQNQISEIQDRQIELKTVGTNEALMELEYLNEKLEGLQNKEIEIQLEIDQKLVPTTLKEISEEIQYLQQQKLTLDPKLNPEAVKEIEKRINELTEREHEIKIEMGIEGPEGSLEWISRKIQEIQAKISKINPKLDPEGLAKLKKELEDLENQEYEIKVATGEINNASVFYKEPKLEKGNREDRRQSYDNTMNQIQQTANDFANGLIDKKQAQEEIDSFIEDLKTQFPDIELKVKLNDDGTITKIKDNLGQVTDAMGGIGSAMTQLGGAMAQLAGDNEGLAKAAAIAQAIGQLVLSFATAMSQAASQGPWAWIAAGVAGVATLGAMISQLQSFNTGGIIEGPQGPDRLMAIKASGGEMVLNKNQQSRLFDMLDGKTTGNSGMTGQVDFRIDGKVLKGVLSNVNKIDNKIK